MLEIFGARRYDLKIFEPFDLSEGERETVGQNLIPEVERERYYQPKKWDHRHKMIAALISAGYKNYEIAEVMDITPNYVSVIRNDPRTVVALEELARTVADATTDTLVRLKLLANEALDEVVDEMRNCEDVRVRQKAAFGILDRAGYTPIQKNLVGSFEISNEIVNRVEEALGETGEIEAEYEVLDTYEEEPEED